MRKMKFELEYDEKELGEKWMNIDNLEICLFSKEYTKRELLKVKEIKQTDEMKTNIKLVNRTGHKLGFAVGMEHNPDGPTVTGILNNEESCSIPDEDIIILHNAELKKD